VAHHRSNVSSLLPLAVGAFYILLALADGDRHGYAISREVDASTSGMVRLGPGNLYRLLRQMVDDGWIVETDQVDADDGRRRYYRLTTYGRRIAEAEAERLTALVRVARTRLMLPAAARAGR
jgi:DNA-binding PadR family transcriptional regulator